LSTTTTTIKRSLCIRARARAWITAVAIVRSSGVCRRPGARALNGPDVIRAGHRGVAGRGRDQWPPRAFRRRTPSPAPVDDRSDSRRTGFGRRVTPARNVRRRPGPGHGSKACADTRPSAVVDTLKPRTESRDTRPTFFPRVFTPFFCFFVSYSDNVNSIVFSRYACHNGWHRERRIIVIIMCRTKFGGKRNARTRMSGTNIIRIQRGKYFGSKTIGTILHQFKTRLRVTDLRVVRFAHIRIYKTRNIIYSCCFFFFFFFMICPRGLPRIYASPVSKRKFQYIQCILCTHTYIL